MSRIERLWVLSSHIFSGICFFSQLEATFDVKATGLIILVTFHDIAPPVFEVFLHVAERIRH